MLILGAGRGAAGGPPAAVVPLPGGRRVLDWLLASFSVLPGPQVHFVGGYRADEVVARYPSIHFSFNPDWEVTGPARSLALLPLESRVATLASYSDVLFRPETVRRVEESAGDVVLAIDTRWRVRYDGRTRAELDSAEKVSLDGRELVSIGPAVPTAEAAAEFAGLVKFTAPTAARLAAALRSGAIPGRAGMPEIVRFLAEEGARTAVVDVEGDWAELNAPQDLARFVLGTKAESLERLRPLVSRGRIGDGLCFTRADWKADRTACVRRIRALFGDRRLVVRSSALDEDSWLQSSAGVYASVLDVPGDDEGAIGAAVDRVIDSYGDARDDHQVLVQEMLSGVVSSGVVMTRTPSRAAPYYTINFDVATSRTDTVTSGTGRSLRTVFLQRGAALAPPLADELGPLLGIVEELEELVGHDSLDIEFAFTGDGRGHVLQVRPIAVSQGHRAVEDESIGTGIDQALRHFEELQGPRPFLVGGATAFSVMADWNPAEMIGTKPGRLAHSLYRSLVTDEAWARQRAEAGYRDVRPCGLMVDFLGHPYIDLRVDFNSFVPAALPDELAGRLVDHYLARLREAPELHDKVEFEVVFTCLDFDFDARSQRLRDAGFDESEVRALRDALREITSRGIARCPEDLLRIETLRARCDVIARTERAPLERARALLADLRRIGIPAFSHLARNAFAAVSLLRSLERRGLDGVPGVDAFLATLRTVPGLLQEDAARVAAGSLSWEELVDRYGHLRPGSYDVSSPRYADLPEEFLRPAVEAAAAAGAASAGEPGERHTAWSAGARRAVERELRTCGLALDAPALEAFLVQAIEGRELAKFHFSRNLSLALEALAEFGLARGLTREDLAQVPVDEILALGGARAEGAERALAGLARRGREAAAVTQAVCLPDILFDASELRCFEQRLARANFVTEKRVRAEAVELGDGRTPGAPVEGRIVLVPSADPGFDWLFSRGIAGLVTRYGGANSHMAVRAAEFGLPAAIGVGELLYDDLCRAAVLELDCATRQIRTVR